MRGSLPRSHCFSKTSTQLIAGSRRRREGGMFFSFSLCCCASFEETMRGKGTNKKLFCSSLLCPALPSSHRHPSLKLALCSPLLSLFSIVLELHYTVVVLILFRLLRNFLSLRTFFPPFHPKKSSFCC